MKAPNLKGQKFNKLTVLEFSHIDKKRQWCWVCECECGSKKTIPSYKITHGYVKSCGCFRKKTNKKGIFRVNHSGRKNGKETSEYRTWQKMKARCCNKNDAAYKHYGGRGIKVCERWLSSFQKFYEDMGSKPTLQHTLDRYPNNNGDYEPSNCRWATKKEQAGNTRRNHWFKTDSGKKLILTDLAKELNVTNNTIHNRINSGKSPFESGRGKIVLDNETGIYYNSAKDAAISKNINAEYLRLQLGGHCRNKTSFIYC